MMKKFLLLSLFLVLLSSVSFVFAEPNGANNVTQISSSRLAASSAGNHSAIAGNVTELTVTGNTITQAWQGYSGNVSGAIRLADSAGNNIYNWSLASPQGEIYASNSSSITWSAVTCFNWSQNGTNLETSFGIGSTDADGVNETFSDSNAHEAFYTGSTQFTSGQCMTAFIFDNTGAAVDNNFEEVLLTDTNHTIFAALLENNLNGFDNKTHDFEMLVLENGHDGDVATTPYFFWVELE